MVVLGVGSFWMIEDYPDRAKFLTPLERVVATSRLRADGLIAEEQASNVLEYHKSVFTDWKTYIGMIMYMGAHMSLSAFAPILPNFIYYPVGFRSRMASVPVYLTGFVSVCLPPPSSN